MRAAALARVRQSLMTDATAGAFSLKLAHILCQGFSRLNHRWQLFAAGNVVFLDLPVVQNPLAGFFVFHQPNRHDLAIRQANLAMPILRRDSSAAALAQREPSHLAVVH